MSRKNAAGTIRRPGQTRRPPALVETSPLRYASVNTGQDSHMMVIAIGARKNSVPKMSIQALARPDRPPVMMSMRTCWLCSSV
jgi:hypothetical protein